MKPTVSRREKYSSLLISLICRVTTNHINKLLRNVFKVAQCCGQETGLHQTAKKHEVTSLKNASELKLIYHFNAPSKKKKKKNKRKNVPQIEWHESIKCSPNKRALALHINQSVKINCDRKL